MAINGGGQIWTKAKSENFPQAEDNIRPTHNAISVRVNGRTGISLSLW